MKMKTVLLGMTFLTFTGFSCADTDADSVSTVPNANNQAMETNTDGAKADNSRQNQNLDLTADQQPSNEKDSQMTSQIRNAIMKDKNLSTYAHNVKIITVDGNVTLKGPVRTAAERTKVFNSARLIAGSTKVRNEMDVTPGVR